MIRVQATETYLCIIIHNTDEIDVNSIKIIFYSSTCTDIEQNTSNTLIRWGYLKMLRCSVCLKSRRKNRASTEIIVHQREVPISNVQSSKKNLAKERLLPAGFFMETRNNFLPAVCNKWAHYILLTNCSLWCDTLGLLK